MVRPVTSTEVLQQIPEQPAPGKPLGRHVNHHPKNWSYRITGPAPQPIPVRHHRVTRAYEQKAGNCTIEAGAGCLTTGPFNLSSVQRKPLATERARLKLYQEETELDGFEGSWPTEDTGSSVLDFCKLAVRHGWASGYEWAMSAPEAEAAILRGSLDVGMLWTSDMDRPDHRGRIRPTGEERGGHSWQVYGRVHDVDEWMWLGFQSWGFSWPEFPADRRSGTFAMGDRDFHSLRERQGEVALLIP